MFGLQVPLVCIPGLEAQWAVRTAEGLFTRVASQVLPEMAGVAELATTVVAHEARLLIVDHQMIFQAVEASEGGCTLATLEWLDS